jgi:hypothetical protein
MHTAGCLGLAKISLALTIYTVVESLQMQTFGGAAEDAVAGHKQSGRENPMAADFALPHDWSF